MYRFYQQVSFFLISVAILSLMRISNAQESPNKLTLQIFGLKNQLGQVCFKIFEKAQDFPYGEKGVIQKKCVDITKRPLQIPINNLSFGNYAIAIFHDINGDQTLQRNFWGIPQEGFGFSNNPLVTLKSGPASFQDAQFNFSQSPAYLSLVIKYSLDRS